MDNMTEWNEFSVHINREATEAVSNIFMELGSAGVSVSDRKDFLQLPEYGFDTLWALDEKDFPEDGVIIKGYFHENTDFDQIEFQLKERVEALKAFDLDIKEYKIQRADVIEEEWANAWKKHYHPVPISRFLTIVPQWEDYEPVNSDERIITLDPGLAFGTGTHPTTRLCLQSLENMIRGGETVIDVGTGSGVLTIASSLFGASTIYAYDLDDVAVTSARDNVALNNLDATITIEPNDLLKGIDLETDIVVANILAEIIVPLIPDAWRVLKPGGLFLSSGIVIEKKEMIIEKLYEQGFQLVQVNQIGDWVAIIAQKPEED
jgi:ribosomal protein L11 methyltransferase